MSNFVLGGMGEGAKGQTRNLELVLLRVDRPNIKNEIRTVRGMRPHVEWHSHIHMQNEICKGLFCEDPD